MKAILFTLSLIATVGCSLGQSLPAGVLVSTQNRTAYCLQLTDTNQLQFDFILDLNNDPEGSLKAINSTGGAEDGCVINFNSTTKVYSLTSVIHIDNATAASNGCGFEYNANLMTYTFRIQYYQFADAINQNQNGGLNRFYTSVCNLSAITPDTRESALGPSVPNLNQDVSIDVPDIVLKLFYETSPNSNNYQQVTMSTPSLSTNTYLRLQLELAFITFDPNKISGVTGLLTQVAGNSDFTGNLVELFNTTGCPSDLNFAPNTTYGFLGPTSTVASSPYIAVTAPFRAWAFPNSTMLAFRVFQGTCRPTTFNADLFCRDPCNNPRTTRRRRNIEEEEEDVAYAYVRVYDPSMTTPGPQLSQSSDDESMMYIGVGVAVGAFVILLAVIVGLLLLRTQSRRKGEPSKKIPPEGFVNHVHDNVS